MFGCKKHSGTQQTASPQLLVNNFSLRLTHVTVMKLISFSTVLCNLQTILARILQAKDVHVSGQIPFQGNFILK